MGYKYFYLEVNEMKGKLFLISVLTIGFFLVFHALPIRAQKLPKTLTLAYSNNMNGEIDPCPT